MENVLSAVLISEDSLKTTPNEMLSILCYGPTNGEKYLLMLDYCAGNWWFNNSVTAEYEKPFVKTSEALRYFADALEKLGD